MGPIPGRSASLPGVIMAQAGYSMQGQRPEDKECRLRTGRLLESGAGDRDAHRPGRVARNLEQDGAVLR